MNTTLAAKPHGVETMLEPFRSELTILKDQAEKIQISDDISEVAALTFISTCKAGYSKMEAERDSLVRPHNDYVREINSSYGAYTKLYDELARAVGQLRSQYLVLKQQKLDEINRKAIAEAEALKREQERKAEEARQEAERLRKEAEKLEEERIAREVQEEMDRLEIEARKQREARAAADALRAGDIEAAKKAEADLEATRQEEARQARESEEKRKAEADEKARLEKAAVKQDMKAETADSKAMLTTPELVSGETKGVRQLESGAKVGTRKAVSWAFTNGMSIEGDYYGDDVRIKDIPLRYLKLDLSKLGKDVKNGNPIPGTIKLDGFATTTRKG